MDATNRESVRPRNGRARHLLRGPVDARAMHGKRTLKAVGLLLVLLLPAVAAGLPTAPAAPVHPNAQGMVEMAGEVIGELADVTVLTPGA